MRKLPWHVGNGWAVLTTAVLALSARPARADLNFPQPCVQRGQWRSGVPLKQGFSFTNKGKTSVTITDLRASCGCLRPHLAQRSYRPGEQGSVSLEVNTLSQPAGPNVWRVQVHYRSADGMQVQNLEVLAELIAEVKVEPAKLAVYTDSTLSHDVAVTDSRPNPFRVTRAQCASPHIGTQVRIDEGGRKGVTRVLLEVKGQLPEGRHEDVLSIFTDDPLYRELRVPVTVVKRSWQSVRASPAAVELTIPRGRAAPSRVVLIRAQGEEEVVVDRVEADDPALTCHWARGPGKMVTLRVGVDAVRCGGTLCSAVRVHVSKPAPTVLTIPVSCKTR